MPQNPIKSDQEDSATEADGNGNTAEKDNPWSIANTVTLHGSHPDALSLGRAHQYFQSGQFDKCRGEIASINSNPNDTPSDIVDACNILQDAMAVDPATLVFAGFCLSLFITILVCL